MAWRVRAPLQDIKHQAELYAFFANHFLVYKHEAGLFNVSHESSSDSLGSSRDEAEQHKALNPGLAALQGVGQRG
jgi:hypothetical protein